MSWSYDDPGLSPKDAVRFYCGDTDENDPLITDEEILFVLKKTQYHVEEIAAQVCEAIAAKFSRLEDKAIGELKGQYSQKAKAYLDLAVRLRKRSDDEADIISTGTTKAPAFRRGMNTIGGF